MPRSRISNVKINPGADKTRNSQTHIPVLHNVESSNDDKRRGHGDTAQVLRTGSKDARRRMVPVGITREIGLPVPVRSIHRQDRRRFQANFGTSPLLPAEEGLDHHQPRQPHIRAEVLLRRSDRNVVHDVPTGAVAAQKRPGQVDTRRKDGSRLRAPEPLQCCQGILIRRRVLLLRCSPATKSTPLTRYPHEYNPGIKRVSDEYHPGMVSDRHR
jgi:hypothetical protein